jgi:uncharacterized protein YjbI with pentapeptide repeats
MTPGWLSRIQRSFAAVATAILVPTVGLWLTYWERDHADREVKRQKYEYAVKQHDEFVRAIGEPLLDGKFNYLDDWEKYERSDYAARINAEASRLNIDIPQSRYSMKSFTEPTPADKPMLSRLYGSRLALVLDAARRTEEGNLRIGAQKQIAKEALHFLRTNRLLSYGGLLSYFSDSDLSDLDLSGVNLSCTNLDVVMRRTDFHGANLAATSFSRSSQDDVVDDSNFSEARLAWARLEVKKITGSSFRQANMQLASLSGSTIRYSNFENADVRHAMLIDSVLDTTNRFAGADLRGAILLIDQQKSAAGKIFAGGIANSKPIEREGGGIIPPTVLPKNMTLSSLGLVDSDKLDISSLRKALPRDADYSHSILLAPRCHWRAEMMIEQAGLYYQFSKKRLSSGSR